PVVRLVGLGRVGGGRPAGRHVRAVRRRGPEVVVGGVVLLHEDDHAGHRGRRHADSVPLLPQGPVRWVFACAARGRACRAGSGSGCAGGAGGQVRLVMTGPGATCPSSPGASGCHAGSSSIRSVATTTAGDRARSAERTRTVPAALAWSRCRSPEPPPAARGSRYRSWVSGYRSAHRSVGVVRIRLMANTGRFAAIQPTASISASPSSRPCRAYAVISAKIRSES